MDAAKEKKWRDVGRKIRDIAPFIAGLLGGPAVGIGAQVLSEVFDSDDPIEVESKIATMTGEQVVELRQQDAAVRKEMLEVERSEIEAATERLRLDNATNSRYVQFLRPTITYAWTLFSMILLAWGVWFMSDAAAARYDAAMTLISTVLITVYGFYFSSRGAEKLAAIVSNRFGSNVVPFPVPKGGVVGGIVERWKNRNKSE